MPTTGDATQGWSTDATGATLPANVTTTTSDTLNFGTSTTTLSAGPIAYRHGGKALVVYFDGHVVEISEGDIKEIDSSKGGKNNPFWKPTAP